MTKQYDDKTNCKVRKQIKNQLYLSFSSSNINKETKTKILNYYLEKLNNEFGIDKEDFNNAFIRIKDTEVLSKILTFLRKEKRQLKTKNVLCKECCNVINNQKCKKGRFDYIDKRELSKPRKCTMFKSCNT